MNIIVVPIGKVESLIIDGLRNDLTRIFGRHASAGTPLPDPAYAYDRLREQYLSTAILKDIAKRKEYEPYEKVLAIVDRDLFVPDLNFIFGEAGNKDK